MASVQLEGITKTFGSITALDGVSLSVRSGSIHAILGENGAGKSTLMNVLFGLYRPDEGSLMVEGQDASMNSPQDASLLGIGMVHQHFMLVDTMTVAENVALTLDAQGLRVDFAAIRKRISEVSATYNLNLKPDTQVGKLSIGAQQRVEILKALYRNARIIIFDEPTSVLAPDEVSGFLGSLRDLRQSGCTILFITHKLDEVMVTADSVTVLRRGKVVATKEITEVDPSVLAELMVGRKVVPPDLYRPHDVGAPTMTFCGVSSTSDRDHRGLHEVSFDLRAGEILAVAGVDGNGQAELAEVAAGLRRVSSGRIDVSGRDITALDVAERMKACHIRFVPEDRHRTGLVLDYGPAENLALRDYRSAAFSRFGIMRHAAMLSNAANLIKQYDVRGASGNQPVRGLSGGNQQKLILAREIEARPEILVVMQPCKGLDIGAIEFVHRMLVRERDRGVAILYISTEFDHILEVADRIAVVCEGEITGILAPADATAERVGKLMAGIKQEAVA